MGKPVFKLTGRSRKRRLWWAPWIVREEYEIYMVYFSSGFFWYSRDQISAYCWWLLEQLPE